MPLQLIASFAMSCDQNLPGALVKRSTGFNLNMKRTELSYYIRLNALCQVETRFVSSRTSTKSKEFTSQGSTCLFSMPSPVLLSSGSMLYTVALIKVYQISLLTV
jgi:hypothetical protein